MRIPSPIYLFTNLEYNLPGESYTIDSEGNQEDNPEGWYYIGTVYYFRDGLDFGKNFGVRYSKFAAGINDDFSWSDYSGIDIKQVTRSLRGKWKSKFIELNNEQLSNLIEELKHWEHRDDLSSVPNTAIRKRIEFCETILNSFRDWYDNNHFKIPANLEHPILTDKEEIKLKEIPPKGLKKLAKEACEALIKEKVIITVLKEKKSDKCISSLVIPKLKEEYLVSPENKKSVSDYFRQGKLLIKKDKDGHLIVTDTYPRKTDK